ncbi:uncharacterized protein Pyn_37115 [Prunus yedoensis var. nudiflora]|uniref:Uncharacterized protein n=1 Tax=Prunus yedoensis var. nudiflora TaxID=2094558 RepID=A0A314ZNX6_PRUYE|nr:uncharacterized protein Pyn_37115 [Prunus yedoensis var. nudiflora]
MVPAFKGDDCGGNAKDLGAQDCAIYSAAPGRKRGREAAGTEATGGEADEVAIVEAAIAEAPDAEAAVAEPLPVATAGPQPVTTAVPALVAAASSEPPPVVLRRPSGIVIRSVSVCSYHNNSASVTPLDEDSKAAIERLHNFLHMGVHHMTNADTFAEFRSCLDTAMALGLLDSAQLDELQVRLAEGKEMISRYAKARMRLTEGCSLEQEPATIKQQAQPVMAQLKENDLVVQRENEELEQVEAQIAELQARRELIFER